MEEEREEAGTGTSAATRGWLSQRLLQQTIWECEIKGPTKPRRDQEQGGGAGLSQVGWVVLLLNCS